MFHIRSFILAVLLQILVLSHLVQAHYPQVTAGPAVDHLRRAEYPHLHAHRHVRRNTTVPGNGTSSAGEAELLVRAGQEAMRKVNKERIENPKFNKDEFADASKASKGGLAPELDIVGLAGNHPIVSRLAKRQNGTSKSTTQSGPYTIPKELAEAARIVAESTPQVRTGNHTETGKTLRDKYGAYKPFNLTNKPEPKKRPGGRLGSFGLSDASQRRDYGSWMVDMQQRGYSPYGPANYQVFRNVMDYGAVGDGVTDDTAAINLAVSDGGRCGANCGSSTTVPAVVYFPPGVYLVSSPIIQYFNTEFLGDYDDRPVILAASSFVGLGMITSDVYVSDNEEWYLNTANFLRSIQNFILDITLADPFAYICAIHWQVAQGTSIENVDFYSTYTWEVEGSNQQGIYMENGSGGMMRDLYFVGGKFGAYFGNQQFTTSYLVFYQCEAGVQVHWDWAWTMHDFIFDSCYDGLLIVGGAGGPKLDAQGVGSLILLDSLFWETTIGIETSLLTENSTSFLIQNCAFYDAWVAVGDQTTFDILIDGVSGEYVYVKNWGFGRVASGEPDSPTVFVNAGDILSMTRNEDLLAWQYEGMQPSFYSWGRPQYWYEPANNVIDVKAMGAAGDGVTDDTAALNSVLAGAANTSSIVYFPYGIYVVTDTLRVPMGSRIIGQVWPQIMGKGSNFEDMQHPRPVVQVGRPTDASGIIEIQSMMFTVGGPTAGAIVVEWNAKAAGYGSVGMWDCHIRVGGAAGSGLQAEDCPRLSGSVNPNCIAASLLFHMTPGSNAHIENMWVWVADHDLDKPGLDQIDIYAGRGVLLQGDRSWLWGTASEHAVLYQYQFSKATNMFLSMIQTESPYFQPTPFAPQPFQTGLFANDPTFGNCGSSGKCAMSWAVRMIDSSTIYLLGAGLYSWFYNYDQQCLDINYCQARGFHVEESSDIWIYNLCTKAIVEMISPLGTEPTYAFDNVNGFLSSILAWLKGGDATIGERDFAGYQIFTDEEIKFEDYPVICKTALTAKILCDGLVSRWTSPTYHGTLENVTLTDIVCDSGCGESLKQYFDNVSSSCEGVLIRDSVPQLLGGFMWAGWNETCLMNQAGTQYCNDVIDDFSLVSTIEDMPDLEICDPCNIERHAMMQKSPYYAYDELFQSDLEYMYSRCGISGPTDIPDPVTPQWQDPTDCGTGQWYTTAGGETCDAIAIANAVSSAGLFMANTYRLETCSSTAVLPAGIDLCLPAPCERTYLLQEGEFCFQIENNAINGIERGDIRRLNPWVGFECTSMHTASQVYGHVLCLEPTYGVNDNDAAGANDTTTPVPNDGYTILPIAPPEGATVLSGTTMKCGRWHVVEDGDACTNICVKGGVTIDLFLQVNTDLGTTALGCTENLVVGTAYCVGPIYGWYMGEGDINTSVTATHTLPLLTYDATVAPTSAASTSQPVP